VRSRPPEGLRGVSAESCGGEETRRGRVCMYAKMTSVGFLKKNSFKKLNSKNTLVINAPSLFMSLYPVHTTEFLIFQNKLFPY